MATTFTPPSLDSHVGEFKGFTPPSLDSHVGEYAGSLPDGPGSGSSKVDAFLANSVVNPNNWLNILGGYAKGLAPHTDTRTVEQQKQDQQQTAENFKTKLKSIHDKLSSGDFTGAARDFFDAKDNDELEGKLAAKITNPMVIGGVAGLAGRAAGAAEGAVTPKSPTLKIVKALRPPSAMPDAYAKFDEVAPFVKQAELPNEEPIHFDPTANKPNNLIGAIGRAKQGAMDALSTFEKPFRDAGGKLDGNAIADEIEGTIPQSLKIKAKVDPRAAEQIQAIRDEAAGYRQPLTLDEVKNLRIETNGQLNSFYHGSPDAQSAKLLSNGGVASLEALVRGTRKLYDSAVGEQGQGLNRVWGKLDDMEAATAARNNPVVINEMAASPLEYMSQKAGEVRQLAGGERLGRPIRTTDSLIRDAFSKVKPSGAYPTYSPPKLALPAGSTPMGSGPDTSGPMYNPRSNSMTTEQLKQLPAASSQVGVSGTIVPDIVDRASRGEGTPARLIESGVRSESPKEVIQPTGGTVIEGKSPRDWSYLPGQKEPGAEVVMARGQEIPNAPSSIKGTAGIPNYSSAQLEYLRKIQRTTGKVTLQDLMRAQRIQ